MRVKNRCDGGYGYTRNTALHLFLSELSPQEKQKYETKLKNEDKEKFLEFKEWEKLIYKE